MNNVVRLYRFEARSSSQTLLCDVHFTEDYPNDGYPQLSICFELGSPKSKAINPSRIRVHARPDLPQRYVIDEVSYFFSTLQQMYQL